ncbi:KpsF/GutQ family protein [Thermodesulfobacterium geofontis OPF15]|jgi:arabinose-5-phosphate isomerase|uniref:KpsF/GutQ family protein n=1 Tax=Thermodesulfobacterium geofontis (strain OPF15) TaxID=795359 RepID=F8C2T4_THEGP|nr:KpsF/GutQ family sugar-phosphate isomerase [Thermodesulfobacterium geofontis]AEH22311.1 KpsF/GutQ family protein [Thermodesulfobacterium geofontis OPF15]
MKEKEVLLERAKEILQIEKLGLEEVSKNLNDSFVQALELILNIKGRVVVTGVGKSGIIGRKISATLSSTGTPSFFLHPVEALHGDLGMVTSEDILLAISYSGNTLEVCELASILKKRNIKIISLTGNPESRLAKLSDIIINTKIPKEACPFNLAPTTSTTATLALGDALAICLFELKGLGSEDFRKNHPGGSLGERLKVKVKEIMLTDEKIPVVSEGTLLEDAIVEIDKKRLGCVLITNSLGILTGIITDGDLRRIFLKYKTYSNLKVEEVMTRNPKVIEENRLASEALEMMEKYLITVLPVINYDQKLVGILHLHDILGKGTFKFTI